VDRIAVSSQSGKLRFYNAGTYELLKTLNFGESANTDNMRYDASPQQLLVGCAGARGAIAMVDPATMDLGPEFRVGSHPESFQLETRGPVIVVNLPDQSSIGVIDRNTGSVTKWKVPGHGNVYAMVFDEQNQRLFTAALQPGRFTVIDVRSGNVVSALPCVLGVDDLWFYADRKRIYAPGSGAIDIFQQIDADMYALLPHVIVKAGSGSTSLHLKSHTQDGLYVSRPNMLPQGRAPRCYFSMSAIDYRGSGSHAHDVLV
jgi:hypothetical protein